MSVRFRLSAMLMLLAAAQSLHAQESSDPRRVGPRAMLPRAREIALARSAAPASVSDSATVWLWADGKYVPAVRGTGSTACYVSRSWPESVEPHCFDAEGAATIMRVDMREIELLHRGMSVDDAQRTIGAELAQGALRLPRRPAMTWMMSAGQQLISDDGRPVGAWRPHVMIFYPNLEGSDLYPGNPDLKAGIISGSGKPTSSLVIIVPEFVQVRAP